MIAYNNEWLNNLLVHDQADKASENQCISKSEKEQVYAAYPAGFYSPNFFVRVGLFILTVIIVAFSVGFFSLFFLDHMEQVGGLFIFFGFIIYAALEFMVKKRHYKSGVDDALMWMAAGNIIGGLNGITHISFLTNSIIVFVIAGYFFIRFTNGVMAAIASLALLAIIFFTVIRLGTIAKAVAPFILMIAAAGIYFFIQQLLKSGKWKYYTNGFLMISVIALVSFYAAGNYFVVREASIAMFKMDLKEGQDIPFGWLFWIFTVAIPILYITRGVQKKDPVLLRVGMLLVAAIVFTVRYYYHLIPAEIAMVAGGMVFIGIAYALIKYLHEPKYGFTHKEQNDAFFMDKLHVESLVIAQTFSGPQLSTTDTGTQFGGGSGGGGGASGEF
ncbi:MAG: hypothetical protein ABIR15_05860 [Chitinophagaceae bacterium]